MITTAAMAKIIAERTGYPKNMVAHVLHEFVKLTKETLYQRVPIQVSRLCVITPYSMTKFIRLPNGTRELRDTLMLSIRPVRGFRKEMNQWKSTLL